MLNNTLQEVAIDATSASVRTALRSDKFGWLNRESKEISERIKYTITNLCPEIRSHWAMRELREAVPVIKDYLPSMLIRLVADYIRDTRFAFHTRMINGRLVCCPYLGS